MVTRASMADDGLPTLADNFQELIDAGVFSEYTQAGGVTFNDEFATFLLRFEDHIVAKYNLTGDKYAPDGHTHPTDGITEGYADGRYVRKGVPVKIT